MGYIAHSAEDNTPEQLYGDHVSGVYEEAENILSRLKPYLKHDKFDPLRTVVLNAAIYHDMGKLCDACQAVLRKKVVDVKMPNHVDAGTYHLHRHGKRLAAKLVFAHHRGWRLNGEEETYPKIRDRAKIKDRCQWAVNEKTIFSSDRMADYTDRIINTLVERQESCINIPMLDGPEFIRDQFTSIWMRFALSILVAADHHDTARNYGNFVTQEYYPLNPQERLDKLVSLTRQKNQEFVGDALQMQRNKHRQLVFEGCLNSEEDARIAICPSEVGTGKTRASLAYALKKCHQHNLRRLIYIAPFISIISQTADDFRGTLQFDWEKEQHIVAEHHHQLDWNDSEEDKVKRYFTQNWDSPIVTSTSVQFFETLAAARTRRLVKFHEMAGSFIVLDEYQDSLPSKMWGIAPHWLEFLTKEIGCRVLLTSGTPVEPWKHFTNWNVPSILPASISEQTRKAENERISVNYNRHKFCGPAELYEWIKQFHGPKVVVCNTIRNAALLTNYIRRSGDEVKQLSTAITPLDRKQILASVKNKLKDKTQNWTLVATSCIEAGIDMSFLHGFRENSGVKSIFQFAGRVNREQEFENAVAHVFELDTSEESPFTRNPDYKIAAEVFREIYEEGNIQSHDCVRAFNREIERSGKSLFDQVRYIFEWEDEQSLGKVERDCRVISDDKITVLIGNQDTKLTRSFVNLNSVQLFETNVNQLMASKLIVPHNNAKEDTLCWVGKYNSLLGYMAQFYS